MLLFSPNFILLNLWWWRFPGGDRYAQCVCGRQRTTVRLGLPFYLHVNSGTKLRLSGCTAGTFTCWAILLAQGPVFFIEDQYVLNGWGRDRNNGLWIEYEMISMGPWFEWIYKTFRSQGPVGEMSGYGAGLEGHLACAFIFLIHWDVTSSCRHLIAMNCNMFSLPWNTSQTMSQSKSFSLELLLTDILSE